jgi:HPt (histidine-containing phosphotransfer) domain-containing protein
VVEVTKEEGVLPMSYSIDIAADELMLEPEELEEILTAFFEDAPILLEQGWRSFHAGEWRQLSRSMHSLKGAAFNMRMDKLGELAASAEKGGPLTSQTLQDIQTELIQMERVFREYYNKGSAASE